MATCAVLAALSAPLGADLSAPLGAGRIDIIEAIDEQHSLFAERLIDGPAGTGDAVSWLNPEPWDTNSYPMSALLTLGDSYSLSQMGYFVGNINLGTDRVVFEYTNEATPIDFQPLVTIDTDHQWGQGRRVPLAGQVARFVRIQFDSPPERFNVSEVRIFGTAISGPTADLEITKDDGANQYVPGETVSYTIDVSNAGPDAANGARLVDTLPSSLLDAQWVCTAANGAVCPQSSGNGDLDETIDGLPANGGLRYILTATVAIDAFGALTNTATIDSPQGVFDPNTQNNSASDTNNAPGMPPADMPQVEVPGPDVQRGFGFGSWPQHTLSATCVELHDRYWIAGPDAKAYHTWHPALATHPDTSEACDFGHEHGDRPDVSPLFEESGGWPPFGYAAEVAGGPRHEDHVGHKITVAEYEAAFGNSADTGATLHSAGFLCNWLSKIHQGSYSMDAFSNHLHEYFLTVRCGDGPTPETSTAFSVKLVYTFGAPNEFQEISIGDTIVAQTVTDPNGVPLPPAMQDLPVNSNPNAINGREFSSAGPFIWKQMEEVTQLDLWTENVTIESGQNGGGLVIGPYYIIKNPARFYNIDETYHPVANQVAYTIDLCYDANGNKLSYGYCATAPAQKPSGWQSAASPFNGTLRAVNFKSLKMYNAGGPTSFCTDAFGRDGHPEPCGPGEIRQTANAINNYWDIGQQAPEDDNYWVNSSGEKIYDEISGSLVGATPLNDGEGGYRSPGIGKEWIVDNRDPDDDGDGQPDGAHIRGEN